MSDAWDQDALDRLSAADEIDISSFRADGSLRPYVTIWGVVAGGAVFVRSAYGPSNGWFRRATASGTGRVRVSGSEWDVAFAAADEAEQSAIDDAYREKYARYPGIVGGIVGPAVHDVTLRLDPLVAG